MYTSVVKFFSISSKIIKTSELNVVSFWMVQFALVSSEKSFIKFKRRLLAASMLLLAGIW